jgi:hypothetical protein
VKRRSLAVALLAVSGYANAEHMECGNRVISLGDSIAKVSGLCGNPARVDRSAIFRGTSESSPHGRSITPGGEDVQIPVEVWVYNFGPNRFMHQIRFEDGRVVRIDRLDYGYR